MLLNTFPFLTFFIIVCFLYWKISQKYQWVMLLVAGYYFFGFWVPAYVGLIVLTTIINYYGALSIHASSRKKTYFTLTILFNLAVLFIFKYFNFFAISFSQVFSLMDVHSYIPQFKLLLPVGISFYTFQTLGYLIDVYRGKIKPERHLGYFALFLCFFPQLSAGPIERAHELLPQLKEKHNFNYLQTVSGIQLFIFGLFKKMVIADNLVIIVDRVFSSPEVYKGLSLIIAVVLFSWQLYADFSGYTDMARGIARILGFNLVENFNTPYLATSIRDFWRRWHMSLSRWFMDYLYVPLGGNKRGLIRTCINGIIVFALCGLWHGASWNFIVWGFFHGLVLAGERIGAKFNGERFHIPNFLAIAYTFAIVNVSWVFFRTSSLSDAWYMLRYAFVGWKNFMTPEYISATLNQLFLLNTVEVAITSVLFVTIVAIELISKITALGPLVRKQHLAMRFTIYVLIIFLIIHLRNAEIKQFIYARF